jgi:hypothetical protein
LIRRRLALDRDQIVARQPDAVALQREERGASIVDLVRGGIVDAELGGLVWLLADGGVPLVVAGPGETADALGARTMVIDALLDLVPSARTRRVLAGEAEAFAWLAGAEGLGWHRDVPAEANPAEPASTLLVAGEMGAGPPAQTTGDRARLVVRALGRGFGLAATARASRLEDLLDLLRHRPIALTDDELSNLGVVLVLADRQVDGPAQPGPRAAFRRVVAAHYLRPLARDAHGHPQRLPPAVLATWDERIARFEHFSWGIAAELAGRVGRRTGDFERECERRSAVLTALAAATDEPWPDRMTVRTALERARLGDEHGGGGQAH